MRRQRAFGRRTGNRTRDPAGGEALRAASENGKAVFGGAGAPLPSEARRSRPQPDAARTFQKGHTIALIAGKQLKKWLDGVILMGYNNMVMDFESILGISER
jgi:hypothetical protein